MKKLLALLLLFSFAFVQVMPVAEAGLGKGAVKVYKAIKAPKVKAYKAPPAIKSPPPMRIPKTPIKSSPVPQKFTMKVNTSKVNIGNTAFTGKQGASLNRIKASVPFKQSPKFTPTYKQPPVMPKQVVKNNFGKQSVKFPKKLYPAKLLNKSLAQNPFKGKTYKQIDKMFKKKKFVRKGKDPVSGRGSYINPKTGRKYYIDKGGVYKKGTELPHVDVHRPSGSSFPKKKFPLGNRLIK